MSGEETWISLLVWMSSAREGRSRMGTGITTESGEGAESVYVLLCAVVAVWMDVGRCRWNPA